MQDLERDVMTLADDLVIGAKAISDETGIKVRQVYRLAELNILPTFKLNGTLAARRSELHKRLSADAEVA
jgi:hypothetical protein